MEAGQPHPIAGVKLVMDKGQQAAYRFVRAEWQAGDQCGIVTLRHGLQVGFDDAMPPPLVQMQQQARALFGQGVFQRVQSLCVCADMRDHAQGAFAEQARRVGEQARDARSVTTAEARLQGQPAQVVLARLLHPVNQGRVFGGAAQRDHARHAAVVRQGFEFRLQISQGHSVHRSGQSEQE